MLALGAAPRFGERPTSGEACMTAPTLPADTPFEEIAHPYDHDLNAQAALDAAFARAANSGKRVLVKLGGDWCPDCRILAGMMAIPAIEAFLDGAFETMTASIGRYDVNQELVARLGFEDGLEGAPTVLVITPAGEVVNRATSAHWRTARSQPPQAVVDYFNALITAPADPGDRVALTQES
jgi:thiol-disulfide isomerase/thioredoxin